MVYMGEMILKLRGKFNSCSVLFFVIASKKRFIRKKISENNGHILAPDVDVDENHFILINMHSSCSEAEHLKTLSKLLRIVFSRGTKFF